jgi:DNA-binding response OmpR family regulator
VGAPAADHRGDRPHQRARPHRGALPRGGRRHVEALLDARAAGRVTAALRRSAVESAQSDRLPISEAELSIDPERMSVIVAGRPANLTPLELKLLWTLAESRSRVLSRDEIFRAVWGGERAHGDRSVDVLVRRLRRKVDEVGGRYTYIQTQHGVGYRFLPTPRRMPLGDSVRRPS